MDRKPLDPSDEVLAFDELVERCMGNIEFAERVLSKFLESFNDVLSDLEAKLDSENPEEIARVAHRLKGASANVGAHGLRDQAAGIESLARAERTSEIRPCLEQLRTEWSRFVESASSLNLSAGSTF